MANSYREDIASAVAALDIQTVVERTRNALQYGLPAKEILDSLNIGMQRIGEKYEEGEYFLTELVFAGDIMKQAVEIVEPHLEALTDSPKETILVGTVKGDLHDLGKNLFAMFAKAAGFDIIDLGIDVAPEAFGEQVRKAAPKIIGMSALMSTTQPSMREVIEMLKKDRTRDNVKVILGGAGITERFGAEIGADAAVNDAMKGSRICSDWIREPNSKI